MNCLRNRIALVFFLALLITSGCRIIPWFGDYGESTEYLPKGEVILSRNVEASQALSFSSPQFKLYIPAGALRYDSRVEITRYPLLLSGLDLPKEYRPVSELYSINVLPAFNTLSQAATLKFSITNAVAGRSYMAAYRESDGKWNFASPLAQTLTSDLVVETLNFSDWLVVERTSDFIGALQQGMQITASPSAAVASTTGFFESDLEISLNLSSNQPLSLSPTSSQLKMQLSAYTGFSLSVTDSDSPESASKVSSDADHSITLDLLNASIASVKTQGNNATCTFIVKLHGIKPAEMPPFIALKALYTTENAISYSAAQTVNFSEAPAEESEETPPPQIIDTLPENGASFVASNTEIQIVFDQNMNRESVQTAIRIGDRAGNELVGTFNWLNDRIMTFTPAALLLPATEYVVRFVEGALGQNELALNVTGEIVFTTLSNDPAELLSYSPTGAEIEYNTPISLKFSRPIDPASLSFTIVPAIPGDFTTAWNDTKTEVSIVFGSGFASAQNYTLTLSKNTCDIYGQEIKSDYSFSFTSKAYVATRLVGILPASGSTDIVPDSNFEFTFDKAVSEADLVNSVSFAPALTGAVNYAWSGGSTKLTVTHNDKLAIGTEYLVTIASTAENQLITTYAIKYKVVEALQVVETIPTADLAGVTTNQTITIKFNNPVNTGTTALSFSPAPVNGYTQAWADGNKTLVLTPNSPGLAEALSYQVSILTATTDIYGSSLAQNHVLTFSTGAFTQPEVSSTLPANNATEVAVNQQVRISFSKSMDKVRTEAALTFTPAATPVFSWQDGDKTMLINFATQLGAATKYQLTFAENTADITGLTIAQPYSLAFTTIAPPPPDPEIPAPATVTENEPANYASSVDTFVPIVLRFSAPIDPETLAFEISPAVAGEYITTWNDAKTEVKIAYSSGFASGQNYTFSLLKSTSDNYGQEVESAYSFSFTSKEYVATRLIAISPASGSIGIAPDSNFEFTFDQAVSKTDIENSISFSPALSGGVDYTWSADSTKLTISHTDTMEFGGDYQVTIASNSSNQLLTTYVISYKVVETLRVVETVPTANLEGVATNQAIEFKFNNPVNTSTIALSFSPAPVNSYTQTWSDANKTLLLTPNSPGLAESLSYQVSILAATSDIYGSSLTQNHALTFSTGAFTQPEVSSTLPENNATAVSVNQQIRIYFNKSMNKAATQEAVTILPAVTPTFSWQDNDSTMLISFAPPLTPATNYVLQIAASAKAADDTELISGYQMTWQTAAQLTVSETVPTANSAGLSLKPSVTIRFNNQIDKTKFAMTWSPEPSSGFTQSWSENDTLLTLTPVADLLESQSYQITIKQATADPFGTTLASDYLLSFTTGAVTAPVISSTTPTAGSYDVAVNQQIKILFSKTMDRAKTQAAVSVSPAATPVFSWQDNDTAMIISLGASLSYDTSYQITIGAGATDKYGLSLAENYLLGFTTVARPTVLTSKCYPLVDSTGIPPQAVVRVEFSKAMNKASAEAAFSLKQASTGVNGSFSWSGNIMSFTPSSSMSYGMLYQISVASSATDSLGNNLSATVSWTFTTAADEGKTWTLEQADTDSTTTFSQRSEHVMISFNNKLWVIGGFDGWDYLNDVWSSSDGKSWTRETAAAAFPARSGHACIVYNGKIWLTGGYSEVSGLFDDVWNSSDGKNWVSASNSAAYYARSAHSMAVFADKLWIIGGETVDGNNTPTLLDDCWSSSDGSNWQSHSSVVTFFPRKLHVSGVVNNRLWIWGGFGEDADANKRALNDVWSTADGEFWRLETSNAAFPARCAAASAMFNNRIWLTGGASNNPYLAGATYYNDIWASSDGSSWVQILGNSAGSSSQFSPRVLHGAAALSDKLFISGGELANSYFLNNEVWSTK